MAELDELKERFEKFKESRYGIPTALILTTIITLLVLIYAWYFCFSYALIAIIAFGVPNYFGLKNLKKLAIFGLFLFIFLGLAFGVSSFYDFKGMEKDPVSSSDGLLTNGTFVGEAGGEEFQFTVTYTGDNSSQIIYLNLTEQWTGSGMYNYTMTQMGGEPGNFNYVYNVTLPDSVYIFEFQTQNGTEWTNSSSGFGPIDVPDQDFLGALLFGRLFLVFFNIALLFYVLLGLVWWTRRSKGKAEEKEQEEEQPEEIGPEGEARERFVCSECGFEVDADAEECPQCGEPFDEEEREKEKKEQFVCSECGADVDASSDKCWNCGKHFEN